MANGDVVTLAIKNYKCGDGTYCANTDNMLWTSSLSGEMKCYVDNASCVLDGEGTRRLLYIGGVSNDGGGKLSLRALTFQNGETQ